MVQMPFTTGKHGTCLVDRQQARRLVRSIRPWRCSPQWLATTWVTSGMSIFFVFFLGEKMEQVVAPFEQSGVAGVIDVDQDSVSVSPSLLWRLRPYIDSGRSVLAIMCGCGAPTLKLLAACDVLTSQPGAGETITRDVIRVLSNFDQRNVLPVLVTQLHPSSQTIIFVQTLPWSAA